MLNIATWGHILSYYSNHQLQRELNYIVTHADLERSESHLLDIVGSTVDCVIEKLEWSCKYYLDKLGEAYDSYREKQAKEIDAITLQMKNME